MCIPLPTRNQRMERKKVKQKSRRKLAISAALSGLLYLALEESIKKFVAYLLSSLTGSK
ncbi:hypothetical protein JOC54_000329 [Alkalihalobacillus xiaoxiensis]|uniref:Uncharacterized protein n=1 Tax=Shouchella xiaoxiensis TaxID=766895 RepID=A0ABS2SNK3_9BACI|nr:hypothetical protein [Shouchella xiaoxiensis]MBM7837098.1 hypothetical protein [Shouchella xiaoxiensis]